MRQFQDLGSHAYHYPRKARRAPAQQCPRCLVDALEPRLLLSTTIATPAIASGWATGATLTPTITVPIGKSLVIPLTDSTSSSLPLTYNVQSSNPNITATVHTGNEFIDLHVTGYVTGDLVFELFNDLTPNTADEISSFVRSGFYNNIIFHRVIAGFVAQAGDPNAASSPSTAGQYGPFNNPDELAASLLYDGNGQLAMARSNHDTNSTQFFITQGPQRFLDYNYSIFGQLVSGFTVFNQIMQVPVNSSTDYPTTAITISSATVIRDTSDAVITLTAAPGTAANATSTITVTTSDGQGNTSAAQAFAVEAVTDPAFDGNGSPIDDQPFINTPQTRSATYGTTASPSINLTTAKNTPITFAVSATDITGAADTFSASITDTQANGAVQVGAVSTTGTTNTGSITLTPNTNFTGVITVQVAVVRYGDSNESVSSADTKTYTIAVGDAPLTITSAAPVPTGAANQFQLVTFTDADSTAQTGTFTASINWGNGTPAVQGTVVAASGGGFAVVGANTSAAVAVGNYTALVTITDAGGAAATAATTSPEIKHPKYVAQLYQDLLGRTADAGGLAYWTNLLDVGQTYQVVAAGIQGSNESNSNLVSATYQYILGRAADPSGLAYWTGQLDTGYSLNSLRASFLGSAEYYADCGGTDAAWVTAIYHFYLNGRDPDPSGLAYWEGVLVNTGVSTVVTQRREYAAKLIGTSMEYFTDIVSGYFTKYLLRPADSGSLATFATALYNGTQTTNQVIVDFVTSTEYFTAHGLA